MQHRFMSIQRRRKESSNGIRNQLPNQTTSRPLMLIHQEDFFNNQQLANVKYELLFQTQTNKTTIIKITPQPQYVNLIQLEFPQIQTQSLHITYSYNQLSNRLTCRSNLLHISNTSGFLFNCKRHYSDLLNGIAQIPLFDKLFIKEIIYFIEFFRVGAPCSHRRHFRRSNTFIKDFSNVLDFIADLHPEPFIIHHNNFNKEDHYLTSSLTSLYPTSFLVKYSKYSNNGNLDECRYA